MCESSVNLGVLGYGWFGVEGPAGGVREVSVRVVC